MIRIKTIHIEEFRGIRVLDLDLEAKNFGICGPNGTGKSGVVDAIEFCITGDVTRLSGQGSVDLSVKAHAPHVDQHGHPEKANVTMTAETPSLGKSVKLHRSVKNPSKLEVTPDDSDIKAIVEELQSHPEFALSRREIVKYIITPPGQRSKDVQTLLRLDRIEKLRESLTTFCNKSKSSLAEENRLYAQAEEDLKHILKVDKLESSNILEKINEKRQLLGLQALAELTKDISFKAGIGAAQEKQEKPALRKTVALADLTALQSAIEEGEPANLVENRRGAMAILEKLKDDEKALILARRHGFIKTGLDLIIEDACPLCDTEWDADELREHLRKKLLSAEEIERLLGQLRDHINTILKSLSERIQAIEHVIEYSQSLKPPIDNAAIGAYLQQLKDMEDTLTGFLTHYNEPGNALQAISSAWWSLEAMTQVQINECQAAVSALSDTSAEDEARDFLTVAQDRYERLQGAKTAAAEARARNAVAQKVLDHYNSSCTQVLEGIYDAVALDFANYYRVINREDEHAIVGKLTPAPAKLSLDVDFYGRGLFPPGAYHSEGHQDAMGLCLYLALMKHTLGERFTFAVLDDVLMSVDAGHRREVCRLLKSEFPDTQFILTTHDRVWLQYMKTEGMIEHSQSFCGWTVDTGPQVWDDQDIWTEIQDSLDQYDIPKAAWLLRRYLEHIAIILADNLRVRIEYRSDGNYNLGDILPHALKEWRRRLEEGEKSAEHWGRDEEKAALAAKCAEARKLIARTNAEQWAINPAVHFNEWENLQRHEFQEVVDAFKELLEKIRCGNKACQSYVYVQPRNGKAEEVRCNCGATIINLRIE